MASSSLRLNHCLYSLYLASPNCFIRGSVHFYASHYSLASRVRILDASCAQRYSPSSILSAILFLTDISVPRKFCHSFSFGRRSSSQLISGRTSFHCSYFLKAKKSYGRAIDSDALLPIPSASSLRRQPRLPVSGSESSAPLAAFFQRTWRTLDWGFRSNASAARIVAGDRLCSFCLTSSASCWLRILGIGTPSRPAVCRP